MKRILIASFDMAIGGVERSLISLLNSINYNQYEVDLMLYKHEGEFFSLIPEGPNLLPEIPQYTTFRKSIIETLKDKQYGICLSRILSKITASLTGKINRISEPGILQMQLMWERALPFLPKADKQYDVAISYLWPHYFVGDKVTAQTKIAWIHTDYSTVETNVDMDLKMWNKFDHIVAVSQECRNAFLKKYGQLEKKVMVIENITSPGFIRKMADEEIYNPMLDDTRFKLLTVARLSHAKGIDNAVKALKILKDQGYDNIAWYIVGYGGDEALINELIARYKLGDSFILLGKKVNPYPFMKACDLYVQPSRYEGKAVTVTEAQILGKPVLLTNYNTAKSQVRDGFDGIITGSGVEGIVFGVKRLVDNPKLRKMLQQNMKNLNYCNYHEIEKLYAIIGK